MEYVWLMLFPAFRINPTAYRSQKPNPKHSMKSISHDFNVNCSRDTSKKSCDMNKTVFRHVQTYFPNTVIKSKTEIVIVVLGGSKRNSTLQRFLCMNTKLTCIEFSFRAWSLYFNKHRNSLSVYKRHKWNTSEIPLYKNRNLGYV